MLTVWCSLPFGVLAVLGIYILWPSQRRQRQRELPQQELHEQLPQEQQRQPQETPEQQQKPTSISQIDFLGHALLAAASILLIFALQEAGAQVWRWSSPVIIWSLATAGACWLLLGGWEYYLFQREKKRLPDSGRKGKQVEPVLPVRLVRDRVYILCVL